MNKLMKIVSDALQIILTIIIIICIYSFISLNILGKDYVNYFSYTVFSIGSNSMAPTITTNDLIIVKLTKNVEKGDIITFKDDKVLVIANEGWQHGIIGIVASKLTEKYYKPTILLTIEEGMATGSARSIKGFSKNDALVESKELITKFGGQDQAAGLSMDARNIDELRQRVNEIADYSLTKEDMIENIKVEYGLQEGQVDLDLVDQLHLLEPFGMSNPTPRFIMRDLVLANIGFVGAAKQHLKLTLQKDSVYEAIGFNMAYLADEFTRGDKVDVLFQLDENN